MQAIDRDYQVLKTLGQGLSGEVFLVQKGGKNLALKLLKPRVGSLSQAEAEHHFKAEFSLLKQLAHPHIGKIQDFGVDPNSKRAYYTSDFIEGRDLFQETRGKSVAEIEELFIQALRALEYLQNHGIAHYDLKPENLLVDAKQRELKLIDFGMAGFRPNKQLAGTPAYMAPEIILGQSPDLRADLYSLGLTFYECLTGNNPFRAASLAETLRRQEGLLAPSARNARPDIPEALSEILDQLMKKNPAERPANAGVALRSLGQLSGRKISLETEATRLSYLPNETKLIGRSSEMTAFNQALEGLQSGVVASPIPMLWIQGPEGIGKSRLLKEMRYTAQLKGLKTQLLQNSPMPALEGPTVLFADELPAGEIDRLLPRLESANQAVLLVASAETLPKDLPETSQVFSLKNFSRDEIQEYLNSLTGLQKPPAKLISDLEKRTQGSPCFLTEMLRAVLRRGGLFDEQGRWSSETAEDLGIDFDAGHTPEGLAARFSGEWNSLDKPAREILQVLALSRTPLSAEALEKLSGAEDVPYWILECLQKSLLTRDESDQAYVLTNPYFKDFLVGQIAEDPTQKLHQAFAKLFKGQERFSEEALYHLGRSGKTPAAQKALVDLGTILENRGLFKEALENFQRAAQIPNSDLKEATNVDMKVAVDLILLHRLPEALEYLDGVRAKLEKSPKDPTATRLKISAYEKLGVAYLRGSALKKAHEAFEQGAKLLQGQEKEFPEKAVLFKNYLARILQLEGNLEKALELFSEAKASWQKLPKASKADVPNNDRAGVLMAMQRFEEARAQLEEDLQFTREAKLKPLEARCLYNLAETLSALKDPQGAARAYEKCIALAKEQKNLEILLRSYNGLGNLHHARKEFAESVKQYERALAIAQKTEDTLSEAGIETNLGIVYHRIQQNAKALPHLKAAIHALQALPDRALQENFLLATALLESAEIASQDRKFPDADLLFNEVADLVHKNLGLESFHFPLAAALSKHLWLQNKGTEAQAKLAELKKLKQSPEQKIEVSKLENLLSGSPETVAREPAITMANLGGRETQESIFLGAGDLATARLLELTRFINAETNLDYVLKNVLQYALELSGAERGLILLLDENERLEIRASINASMNPDLSKFSSKTAEHVLTSGEMVETDDATQDDRFNEYQSVMILKLRSILCLPIRSRNKTVGVLYLDHRYRPKVFAKNRHALLQAFCDQAGIAIENAKLFEKYERVQAELQRRLETAQAEAEHYHELLGENAGKLPTKYAYDNIVARSKPMYEVFKLLDKITETNISVFINGETGTGKELIAKALHYNNPARAKARFVAINCGGIPPNLIESELFGYKAGAFTGASRDKKGLFVEADGGTLFMDEVADLDHALQVKLLRALEEGEVIPVGDTRPVRFDVRIVSASHKRLEDLIREGKFREDLYYRICQIRIALPPLRDRREDIPLLIEKFAQNYAQEHGRKKVSKVSGSLMKRLLDYSWPGNIRELENTIRVSCALSDSGELTVKDLPENFGQRTADLGMSFSQERPPASPRGDNSASSALAKIDGRNAYDSRLNWEDYEKLIFAKAFEAKGFKPLEAAEALSVSPATFYKRIKDFDLNNRGNALYQDAFHWTEGKSLREYLEDIFWAAYQASSEKAYTAIKWLDVSQGHFYNVLKAAKRRNP